MTSTQDELVNALRKSLKENERLKRENREYLALTTEPVAVGRPVSRQITAVNSRPGAPTYAAKHLPKGLRINRVTGLVTGTPKKAGQYRTVISITNSAARSTRSIRVT